VRQLLHLRKERRSLAYGKLVHFPVVNESYVYLRIFGDEKTLVVVNNRDEAQKVSMAPFRQYLSNARTLRNLITGITIDLQTASDLDVPADDALILAVH
jgi:hypothetical protein